MSLHSFVSEHKVGFRQLLFYGVIGAFCATMDFFSFTFLRRIGAPLLLANLISVHVGITLSFLLNAFFNFKRTDHFFRRSLIFLCVGYVGLAISSGLLFLGVSVFELNETFVKLATIVFVAAIQFVLNRTISFKEMEL